MPSVFEFVVRDDLRIEDDVEGVGDVVEGSCEDAR